MSISQTITSLPEAPSREHPDTFATLADAFLSALEGMPAEQNTMASQMNAVASSVNADATAAAASVSTLQSLVDYKGDYDAGTTYALGDSVNYNGLIWISDIDSNTGNTPSYTSTQWSCISSNIRGQLETSTPTSTLTLTSESKFVQHIDCTNDPVIQLPAGSPGLKFYFYLENVGCTTFLNASGTYECFINSTPDYPFFAILLADGSWKFTSATENIGVFNASIFESATTDYISVAMLTDSKAIVCYRDNGHSNYGTACILDVSGSTITAGTPVIFESASTAYISVAMLTDSKAIVCYINSLNYGTACILDVSGSTITAGTPAVFNSATTYVISVAMLTDSKAIVCYRDNGHSNYGTACILDVSGSTITAGTSVVFENATTYDVSVAMLTDSKAIVCYEISSYGKACILDISGSTITAGTPAVFESASTTYISVAMLSSTKAIVCYEISSYGTACILDVSGSTITAGTPAVFENASTTYISVAMLSSTKAIVCYQDAGNLYYGTACILDVSGSTITAGTPAVFNSANTYYISVAMLSSTKVIVCYQDSGSANYGTACILEVLL